MAEPGQRHAQADVVISFDTTGSMAQCIREVRRQIVTTLNRIFTSVPNIRIGIVAHGDYCDERSSYLMKHVDLTNDRDALVRFVEETGDTGGGDVPEAYEHVLREVQKFDWRAPTIRILVMIGDAYPHEKDKNPRNIDWRHECDELAAQGIAIYGVQALGRRGPAYTFFKTMAEKTHGHHLMMDQFTYIHAFLTAICLRQADKDQLMLYEQEVKDAGLGQLRNFQELFATMFGRAAPVPDEKYVAAVDDYRDDDVVARPRAARRRPAAAKKGAPLAPPPAADGAALEAALHRCPPAKYQIMDIDADSSIKDFVINRGVAFKVGRGYYEFTKPEIIQAEKHIVLWDKATGDLYEGETARRLIGLAADAPGRQRPADHPRWRIFVQSTSANRKLLAGTKFLYQAADYREEEEGEEGAVAVAV